MRGRVQTRERAYSAQTTQALRALGTQIAIARRERRWSIAELAERAGVAPNTVRAVENGAPTASVGVTFEIAVLVGVPLFGTGDPSELTAIADAASGRLALLPARVRQTQDRDDDF